MLIKKDIQGKDQFAVKANATKLTTIASFTANGTIFSRFNPDTDIVSNYKETVSATCWSNTDDVLTQFWTSSAEIALSSSHYYWNLYQSRNAAVSSSEPQFSISYGNINGKGSVTGSPAGYSGNLTGSRTPSRAIYSQYRNLLLQPDDTRFTFGTSSKDDIYVINFARARYKEKLDPGNWQLNLSGSVQGLTLIDNSGASTNPEINAAGRVFNIVSGSIANGTASVSTIYGLSYPDVGILVLDPVAISSSIGIGLNTSSFVDAVGGGGTGSNNYRLYLAISGGAMFQARNEENINSSYYYVRVKHFEFNYSNNPTFTTGSLGLVRLSNFVQNPKVYITTVGLYNDTNELLAVAKLSRPLLKDFTRESLVRIKLDF